MITILNIQLHKDSINTISKLRRSLYAGTTDIFSAISKGFGSYTFNATGTYSGFKITYARIISLIGGSASFALSK